MLDVLNAFEELLDLDFKQQVTAVLSEVYMLNGHLCGEVFGDKSKRFKNGTRIMTSPVSFGIEVLGHQLYLTRTGSVYLVSSWRKFDETWKGMSFADGIHPIDFLLSTSPERGDDFSEDQEVTSSLETELIKMQIPKRRANRAIFLDAETGPDQEQIADELNSKIFELATLHLDTGELAQKLEAAQRRIVLDTKSEVLIEYTKRHPDPFLLPLIALGFLPRWQAVLVLDGQFNVSRRATSDLANELLIVLPVEVLTEQLRERRMTLDLGL
jgi:hypothetical protein